MIKWIKENAIFTLFLISTIFAAILMIWLKPIKDNYKENNYDVNKDGEVDLMDLYELREYLLKDGD